ncbi:peptidoglycan-associated lipoprotein Pal [Parashewanella curva]|uniref:Peptidoglycan-associated lipoprotein n=1 Tax=Parashewanella curva TaxID=2338552 RepID=A0A3L8PUX6_9GAMM|nr:peptidoglycan-associated lipoprotein Pal [Parashewanella curva]RLV58228.1 peptidoglycan-associated lipoprotein Pal [Parashewanella curva]
MDLNKLLKAMLVALPVLAISACSSTSTESTQGNGSNGTEVSNGGVETGSATVIKTPEEIRAEKEAELRKDNVIYFDFDNSQIKAAFAENLRAHGNYLLEHPNVKVMIEGHTDERGTPEYNIALGERRAKAVQKFLQNMGVQASQMTVVSYGEEKPANPGHTEAAFAQNRRAVLVY